PHAPRMPRSRCGHRRGSAQSVDPEVMQDAEPMEQVIGAEKQDYGTQGSMGDLHPRDTAAPHRKLHDPESKSDGHNAADNATQAEVCAARRDTLTLNNIDALDREDEGQHHCDQPGDLLLGHPERWRINSALRRPAPGVRLVSRGRLPLV